MLRRFQQRESPNKAFIKDCAILRSPVDRLSSYIPIQVGFPRVVWHRRVIEDIYMGLGPPELLPVRIAAYPAGAAWARHQGYEIMLIAVSSNLWEISLSRPGCSTAQAATRSSPNCGEIASEWEIMIGNDV